MFDQYSEKDNPQHYYEVLLLAAIFQTIAVALALKSCGSSHSAMDALGLGSAEGYDWLLVISFWVLTPAMLFVQAWEMYISRSSSSRIFCMSSGEYF